MSKSIVKHLRPTRTPIGLSLIFVRSPQNHLFWFSLFSSKNILSELLYSFACRVVFTEKLWMGAEFTDPKTNLSIVFRTAALVMLH